LQERCENRKHAAFFSFAWNIDPDR